MNNKNSELFSIVHGASLNEETASGLEWRVSTEEAQLHLLRYSLLRIPKW